MIIPTFFWPLLELETLRCIVNSYVLVRTMKRKRVVAMKLLASHLRFAFNMS